MLYRPRTSIAVLALSAVVAGSLAATQPHADAASAADWSMGGQNHANSRSNPLERGIGRSNAARLGVKWTQTTTGDVSATPAVVNGHLYYPDWGGTFWKVRADTGQIVWSRKVADYVGIPNAVSRSSPAVVGGTAYIGTQDGAWLLAVDTATGNLRWKTQTDTHPMAILTQSPTVADGIVYQGVSSRESFAAGNPGYACCTFRSSLVATSAATGRVLWKTHAIDDQGPGTDIYSGAAIWGGLPAVDQRSDTVYVTTGQNYRVPRAAEECRAAGGTPAECNPKWNRFNSVIALDMFTGAIKWSTGQDRFDAWNLSCRPGQPPNNCPMFPGPDHDLSTGAHLYTLRGADGRSRPAVGAGQKSGEYWMLDARTGEVIWSAAAGPGSELGGIEFGTAHDGARIYFAQSNWWAQEYQLPDGQTIDYSSFGALDVQTGKVLWQVPEPHGGHSLAAAATANGVAYFSSMNNHMYALDGLTGRVLWDYTGQGSSAAGPAVAGGMVYWGNGYVRFGRGSPSTTFYAFTPR